MGGSLTNAGAPVLRQAPVHNGVHDLSAIEADVGKHTVVEFHQAVDVAAYPALMSDTLQLSTNYSSQQRPWGVGLRTTLRYLGFYKIAAHCHISFCVRSRR